MIYRTGWWPWVAVRPEGFVELVGGGAAGAAGGEVDDDLGVEAQPFGGLLAGGFDGDGAEDGDSSKMGAVCAPMTANSGGGEPVTGPECAPSV